MGVIPFRVSNSPSNYPARAQYSFYVPLHETFWFNYIICDTLRNINSFWQNRLAIFYCTPLLTTVYDFQALGTDQPKIISSVTSGLKNIVFEIPLHSNVTFCSCGTLNHIHVGLAILFCHRLGLTLSLFSKVNLKDFVGIVAIFLMHKERRKDFQAICRAVFNGFNQEHICLTSHLRIDELDAFRC